MTAVQMAGNPGGLRYLCISSNRGVCVHPHGNHTAGRAHHALISLRRYDPIRLALKFISPRWFTQAPQACSRNHIHHAVAS